MMTAAGASVLSSYPRAKKTYQDLGHYVLSVAPSYVSRHGIKARTKIVVGMSCMNKPVAVIGSLGDLDLNVGEILLSQDADVTIFRARNEKRPNLSLPYFARLQQKHIFFFRTPYDLLWRLKGYGFVYSITSYLFFHLQNLSFIYPLLTKIGWPKYMVINTGSDVAERAAEQSRSGFIQRFSLRNSFCTTILNYPHAIKNILQLGKCRWILLPAPYMAYRYRESWQAQEPRPGPMIKFLHASHLDWGQEDNKPGRTSTKGNDRFLKAFIHACKNNLNAHCVILDRGPDRENAKRLIRELNGEQYFTWKPNLTRQEFHDELEECDVVVDQFDVGGYGGIAVEALDHGKTLMTYIHPVCNSLLFGREIPVINVHTEEEIVEGLMRCRNREYLNAMAKRGREWVENYLAMEVLGKRYLFYAEMAMGKCPVKYGWTKGTSC